MAFDLFKTITEFIEPAVDFFTESSADTAGPRGYTRKGGSGFLDFAKTGLQAYKAMTDDDDDREAFKAAQYKEPQITRYRGRAAPGGLTQGVTPVGMRNPDVQTLVRNLMRRQYSNPHMSRIQQDYAIRRTIPQGKRTMAVEAARLPSVQEMAPATVRKEAKE